MSNKFSNFILAHSGITSQEQECHKLKIKWEKVKYILSFCKDMNSVVFQSSV